MKRVIQLQRLSAWVFLVGFLLHVHVPLSVQGPATPWLTAVVVLSGLVHAATGLWIGGLDVVRTPRRASLAVGVGLFGALALVGVSTQAQKPPPGEQPQHREANAGRCAACHAPAEASPHFSGTLAGPNVHGEMACPICHTRTDPTASCKMCHPRDDHGEVWTLMPERPFLTGEGVHFLTCASCHPEGKAE